jgi:hypothetical protein
MGQTDQQQTGPPADTGRTGVVATGRMLVKAVDSIPPGSLSNPGVGKALVLRRGPGGRGFVATEETVDVESVLNVVVHAGAIAWVAGFENDQGGFDWCLTGT